ncbi:MAG: hypothetical protein J6Y19_02550 [Kiritimatiellae bacterium]|nr:hypothetical protein [Kiritimatiellia bacterium]
MFGKLTESDWRAFEQLDGSPPSNFEALWRSLVLNNYGGKGRLLEYKNHPGVEFLLDLTADIPGLDPSGSTVGWQCKYFGTIRSGKSLSKAQKNDILESFRNAKKNHPSIAKWILCIPGKLAKKDVIWLHSLSSRDTEVLEWNDDDIVRHMASSEHGHHLREAYFGQLQLSETDLEKAFELTFAPLKKRWLPEVHVRSAEEDAIRRYLLEPVSLGPLSRAHDQLSDLRRYFSGKEDETEAFAWQTIDACNARLQELLDALAAGSLRPVEALKRWMRSIKTDVARHIMLLRGKRDARNLPFSNVLYVCDTIIDQLGKIEAESKALVVAIMADAGWGKTHLAASILLNGEGRRKGGILLLAKELGKDDDFSALVRRVRLPGGRSFQNTEELLLALHEFGNRHQCRVPLVVDGLNESQNPSAWKDIISRLSVLLRLYPNVLLVVTFRTGYCSGWSQDVVIDYGETSVRNAYKEMCLPDDIPCLEASLSHDFQELAARYFAYYRIEYHGPIPEILKHPLTLRLFCEATNADRNRMVRPGSLPLDTSAVFDGFCESVAKHIENQAPAKFRRRSCEYRERIRDIGKLLWKSGKRFASVPDLKTMFPPTSSSWQDDWENVLSQEGLILTRPDWKNPDRTVFEAAYDAFGGFLVADYLTTKYASNFPALFSSKLFQNKIVQGKHELSEDILSFLTWLYPRKNHGRMLLEIAPENIRHRVLFKTVDCDDCYLGRSLLESIRQEAAADTLFAKRCYEKTLSNLFNPDARLNARFLDALLDPMPPVTRDRQWGFWVFDNRVELFLGLGRFLEKLPNADESRVEPLFILCKWLLVSVVLSLRDRASRLLVHLGEKYPERVLFLISSSLQNNDQYVVERLTAVAYGILMSLFATRKLDILKEAGENYLRSAESTLLAADSTYATSNAVILDSVINASVLLERVRDGTAVQDMTSPPAPRRVPVDPFRRPEQTSTSDRGQVVNAIFMDFENYTLTRVIGLHPYDTQNEQYREMRAQFEQRMFDLGYCHSFFERIDRDMQHEFPYLKPHLSIERFGKKYDRIVYHEMKGVKDGDVSPLERTLEDIVDPSFPEPPQALAGEFIEPCFPPSQDAESWILDGGIPNCLDTLVRQFPDTGGEKWVLVAGNVTRISPDGKKSLFATFDGFLADKKRIRVLMNHQEEISYAQIPSRYHCYHLETPWAFHYRFDKYEPDKDISTIHPLEIDAFPHSRGMDPLPCEVPAEWYEMESTPWDTEEKPYGMLVSHCIAARLDLRPVPHRWEFLDSSGRLASRFFSVEKGENKYSLLYLRKDLLIRYLAMEKKSFALVFHGERDFAPGEFRKHENFFLNLPRDVGQFHEMYLFRRTGFKKV